MKRRGAWLRCATAFKRPAHEEWRGFTAPPPLRTPLSPERRLLAGREIYHREDGSERLGSPRRLPIGGFFEETFGGWYQAPGHPRRSRERPGACKYPWTSARSGVDQPAPELRLRPTCVTQDIEDSVGNDDVVLQELDHGLNHGRG